MVRWSLLRPLSPEPKLKYIGVGSMCCWPACVVGALGSDTFLEANVGDEHANVDDIAVKDNNVDDVVVDDLGNCGNRQVGRGKAALGEHIIE